MVEEVGQLLIVVQFIGATGPYTHIRFGNQWIAASLRKSPDTRFGSVPLHLASGGDVPFGIVFLHLRFLLDRMDMIGTNTGRHVEVGTEACVLL